MARNLPADGGGSDKVLPDVQDAIRQTRTLVGTPDKAKSIAKTTKDVVRNATRGTASAPGDAAAVKTAGTLGKLTKGGLGALGVAGGTLQTLSGINELRHGDMATGTKDTAAGSLTTAASVAGIAGKFKVAGPLGGGAAIVSGGFDLYNGIDQGNSEKAVMGGAKTVGGGLLVASAFASGTIVGAPAGAVLAAAGGAILLGATAWENRDAIVKGAKWAGGKVADGANWAYDKGAQAVGAVKSLGSKAAGGAKKLAGKVFGGW